MGMVIRVSNVKFLCRVCVDILFPLVDRQITGVGEGLFLADFQSILRVVFWVLSRAFRGSQTTRVFWGEWEIEVAVWCVANDMGEGVVRSVKVGEFGGCLGLGMVCIWGVYGLSFRSFGLVFFGSWCVGEARGVLGRTSVRFLGFNRGHPHAHAAHVQKHA